MQIRPSSALRNDYTQISELAKVSGEPTFTPEEINEGMEALFRAYEK